MYSGMTGGEPQPMMVRVVLAVARVGGGKARVRART